MKIIGLVWLCLFFLPLSATASIEASSATTETASSHPRYICGPMGALIYPLVDSHEAIYAALESQYRSTRDEYLERNTKNLAEFQLNFAKLPTKIGNFIKPKHEAYLLAQEKTLTVFLKEEDRPGAMVIWRNELMHSYLELVKTLETLNRGICR